MYLSHPVRRMRDDPVEGEEVTLIVEAGDRAPDEVAAAVEDADGASEERLRFGSLRVTVAQDRLDAICSLDGIESITTDNAVGIGGDAGEDVG